MKNSIKIVILDDSILIRASLYKLFKSDIDNADIILLSSIDDYFKYEGSGGFNDVDFFICDWKMPKTSGENVICLTKIKHPNVIGILYTGYVDKSIQDKFWVYGVDKIFYKVGGGSGSMVKYMQSIIESQLNLEISE